MILGYTLTTFPNSLIQTENNKKNLHRIASSKRRTLQDKLNTYEKALKNTLFNKFAIETPNNKLQEVTLQDGSKELDYLPGTIMDYASMHG